MRTSLPIAALLAIGALAVGGCGSDDSGSASAGGDGGIAAKPAKADVAKSVVFVEGRYHIAFTEEQSTKYTTLRAGLSLRL